jgi:hypothetical protein
VRCKDFGVAQIMVGVHRVGLVGLNEALEHAVDSGLTDREEIVDSLIEFLSGENYFPDRRVEEFRIALWREYLRCRGEDFSDFYSRVEVRVRGEAGPDRDEFVGLVRAAFADHELEPVVEFEPGECRGPGPELLIGDHLVVAGLASPDDFKTNVRKSFSEW